MIYFIYKIAIKLKYTKADSIILALGFTLGSVYIGVATVPSSWLFAQVVSTFLLFWSLYEYYYRKRWWLIGLICGFIVLTRFTAIPIVLFFSLELWNLTNSKKKEKMKLFGQLFIPIISGIGLLGLYNYLRFQSPLNGGYAYQLLFPDSVESKSLGIFSLKHIPTNFYAAVIQTPITVLRDKTSWTLKFPYIKNNPYGLSIFITSPYLITLFTHKWTSFNRQAKHLLFATTVSVIAVFSFYGIGKDQFGYRYSLDFLPPLFLLFMIMYRRNNDKLSNGMKFLLIASGIIDIYIAWSFIFP